MINVIWSDYSSSFVSLEEATKEIKDVYNESREFPDKVVEIDENGKEIKWFNCHLTLEVNENA